MECESNSLSGMTIVYAEDDMFIRKFLAKRLRVAGARVVEAKHGAEALAKLELVQAECLLLDLQMPVLDGLETLRRLRERAPSASFAIFVLTSSASEAIVAEAHVLGADRVFPKGIEVSSIISALCDVQRTAD